MSFLIDPRQPFAAEVRRIAAEEIGKAMGSLETAAKRPDKSLHDCRKHLKNVRALFNLVRSGDARFIHAENARYRAVSASVAGSRDVTALIETVDRLAKAYPKEAHGGRLDLMRARLMTRRNEMLGDAHALRALADAAIAACSSGMRELDELALPEGSEDVADILAEGAGAAMRRARKALEKCRSRGDADDFHDLRKAVKTHAMHLALLKRLWPKPAKARRKALDQLGERLGELHDGFALAKLIGGDDKPLGSRSETRLLSALLKRAGKSLRKHCLAEAEELFSESPRHSTKKLARKARARDGFGQPPIEAPLDPPH